MPDTPSLATSQRPLTDETVSHPLEPPLTAGCPESSTETVQVPLEVDYDYAAVDPALFERAVDPGLDRWAPLLPPLAGAGLGAGGTPLLETPSVAEWAGVETPVYVKDESQNPTWSHKDRFMRLVQSSAIRTDADGIVAYSTGNHGASAAAHAARASLPAVVLMKPDAPASMQTFVRAYGGAAVRLDDYSQRAALVDALARRGYHPATSRTPVHTGHPYGPEGYKTIAYETYLQLGRVPGSVFLPASAAELAYGVWKGFRELARLGVARTTPRMMACEPESQAALAEARRRGEPIVEIDYGDSEAVSIGATRSTHRGFYALEQSDGAAVPVSDDRMRRAQECLAATGLWIELSGTAGVAGLEVVGAPVEGPIVAIACSSGFKDGAERLAPRAAPTVDAVEATLREEYGLELPDES